jgi:hypothetical protein
MQAHPMMAMMAIRKSLSLNDPETQPDGLWRSLDYIVLRTYGADLMDATELLKELEKRDIVPWEEAGRLRLRARRGSLTDDLRRRIHEHKEGLVEILRAESPSPEPAAAPLLPEGRIGEHREPCPDCGNTWSWPTVSGETGELGWACARCLVSRSQPIHFIPEDGGEPITVPLDTGAPPPVDATTHPRTGRRYVTRLHPCPRCGGRDWGPTGHTEPDGSESWTCLGCGASSGLAADAPPPESRTPPSPIGQARERCARCSGSWYYPASDGWVCSMCVARKAAAGATTPAPGLTSCLLDFVDTLAVADPEGAITGRDLIEVFAPYQHARGIRPSPPREVWGALEKLGYKVRGEDAPEPLIMGLRLVLGEEG